MAPAPNRGPTEARLIHPRHAVVKKYELVYRQRSWFTKSPGWYWVICTAVPLSRGERNTDETLRIRRSLHDDRRRTHCTGTTEAGSGGVHAAGGRGLTGDASSDSLPEPGFANRLRTANGVEHPRDLPEGQGQGEDTGERPIPPFEVTLAQPPAVEHPGLDPSEHCPGNGGVTPRGLLNHDVVALVPPEIRDEPPRAKLLHQPIRGLLVVRRADIDRFGGDVLHPLPQMVRVELRVKTRLQLELPSRTAAGETEKVTFRARVLGLNRARQAGQCQTAMYRTLHRIDVT